MRLSNILQHLAHTFSYGLRLFIIWHTVFLWFWYCFWKFSTRFLRRVIGADFSKWLRGEISVAERVAESHEKVGYGEGVSPIRGGAWGGGCAPSPEKSLQFLAEINAFWWYFDAVLIPIEMHNYRPTSTYILLGGSGLQSNLVIIHWLTQFEPYDYEYESTTII